MGQKEYLHIKKEFKGKARADKASDNRVSDSKTQAVTQLLYGTGNHAKLAAMQRRLEPLSLKIIGLKDIAQKFPSIPKVREDGVTPLEKGYRKRNSRAFV